MNANAPSSEHIVKSYDDELKRLTGEIQRMGDLALVQLDAAIESHFASAPTKRVYVMTDKPLYQPGETLYYRADVRATGTLIGVSTGGYCSLKLAMMDSDRFAAAADISGYFDALQDHTTGILYANSQDVRNENDLMWRIEHLPPPPVSALLTTSKTGEVNYQPTMQFAALAKAPMQVSTLAEPEGGHNFEAWSVEIGPALAWLSDHLATPRASAAPATTN